MGASSWGCDGRAILLHPRRQTRPGALAARHVNGPIGEPSPPCSRKEGWLRVSRRRVYMRHSQSVRTGLVALALVCAAASPTAFAKDEVTRSLPFSPGETLHLRSDLGD